MLYNASFTLVKLTNDNFLKTSGILPKTAFVIREANINNILLKMMRKRNSKTLWGEFTDLQNAKVEVKNCLTILPPDKRTKLESLPPAEDKPATKR